MQEQWTGLRQYWEGATLCGLFRDNPQRGQQYAAEVAGLRIDWSRQFIDEQSLKQLAQLSETAGLIEARDALFAGEAVNRSEGRSALHMALRAPNDRDWQAAGVPVSEAVSAELDHMAAFVEALHEGRLRGSTGQPIRDVVNIGIGGSHLGPEVLVRALPAAARAPRVHFLSNVDPAQAQNLLSQLEPESTLFVVVSKSFSSRETMINAREARRWIAEPLGETAVAAHFAAVSTSPERVASFGIPEDRRFRFWDWVGGRYSVWSAAGLAAAIHLGMPAFRALLAGAAEMDRHFESAPLERNAPMLMGLLDIQSLVAFQWPAWAVVPYSESLALLPDYFQQLVMESNGKGVTQTGEILSDGSGPLLLGGVGTDAQHAFFQLLHQGPCPVPVDFIALAQSPACTSGPSDSIHDRHRVLLANCLAQAQALATGRKQPEVEADLEQAGVDAATIRTLAPQKRFPGNRPSSMMLMQRLEAREMGALLALYEHRVFVQACLLGINPFDQMGVELGKRLAGDMEARLAEGIAEDDADSAVKESVRWLKNQWEGTSR